MTVTSGFTGQGAFTGTLTSASLDITKEMGFSSVSIAYVSGTVTITGTRTAGSLQPSAVTLSATLSGFSFVVSAGAIDGIEIDASAGSCAIIAQ